MSIPDFKIEDLVSFQAVTNEPHEIAGLYFYQLLDCLVDLAYQVSADFRKRPQLYRDLGGIAPILAGLNAKYGTEVNFLSGNERAEVYLPIFGSWDGSSSNPSDSFPRLRDDLVRAATAFAGSALERNVVMLKEGVRTAHIPFKDYLLGLRGDSIIFSKDQALFDLTENTCYPILRNQGVAAVFGLTDLDLKDVANYPYGIDPDEDTLVEQICGQLKQIANSPPMYLTRERISNRQRAALRGAEAIATAIEFPDKNPTDEDFDFLITKCYTWGTALASLNGQPKMSQPLPQPVVSPTTTPARMTGPPTTAAVPGLR
jgi:hypothetical protein